MYIKNICRSTCLAHKTMDLMLKIFNFIFPKVWKNWLVTFVHRTLDLITGC